MLDTKLAIRADAAVRWLWAQSDALIVRYANDGGGLSIGYPTWWLQSPEVGYTSGPKADRET